MKPKSLLLLALAGGCGLVASIGISQVMDKNAQRGPALETAPIYVALHNINLGDPIDATMVSLMEWPKDKIPPGALTQIEDISQIIVDSISPIGDYQGSVEYRQSMAVVLAKRALQQCL